MISAAAEAKGGNTGAALLHEAARPIARPDHAKRDLVVIGAFVTLLASQTKRGRQA